MSNQLASDGRGIEWTGERCVPWVEDAEVVYEHLHRYAFAAELVADARVLDLACGEGFGAAMLRARAREVVAVDIDRATVDHARRTYRAPGLEFRVGSITDPDLLADEDPFDVITCFEAIEHVEDHEAVLRLIAARLRPGGLVLMSTPDTTVYQGHDHRDNPFHVKELTASEFASLLGSRFPNVVMFRQATTVGSVIVDPSGRDGGTSGYTLQDARSATVGTGLPHTYLVAVAGDGPLPQLPSGSVLADPGRALVAQSSSAVQEQLGTALSQVAELNELYRESRLEVDRLKSTVSSLEDARRLAESRATSAELGAASAESRAASADARATAAESRAASAEAALVRAQAIEEQMTATEDSLRAALAAVSGLRRELAEAERQCAIARAELVAVQGSRAMRVVEGYRSRVERALPNGSRRRQLYSRVLGNPEPGPTATDGRPLALPSSAQPVVSIVIPVHGQWEYTLRCLRSIEANPPKVPFEVVVVDDASPDDTADRLRVVPGVRTLTLPQNVGYLKACNAAFPLCVGEYVLLLNNDTEVTPGWLEALHDVADADETVGAVGSRLVYPDGRLQEAGGVIYADGTGCNVGKFHDADASAFSFRREVHYSSAASLLVRADVLREIGGFDERFAPAYYEDTDLCFEIRRRGLKVVYEPRSTVVHYEGISHGTDEAVGLKAFQNINRIKFVDKWRDVLASHPVDSAQPHEVLVHPEAAGVLLVVDHYVPRPDEDSGSKRIVNLMALLRGMGYGIVFLPDDRHRTPGYADALQELGIEVLSGHFDLRAVLRRLEPVVTGVIISRTSVAAKYLLEIRQSLPAVPVVFDTVDLHFLREFRQADLENSPALLRRAATTREIELGLVRACDVTLVVSPVERDLLEIEAPDAKIEVVPTVHWAEVSSASVAGRDGLLFVCSFAHTPNVDGLVWFLREIWPSVRQAVPDLQFDIVGRDPVPVVVEAVAQSEGVRLLGWVPDLTPVYGRARVAMAPLRFGAGIKGKVGEAMSFGVPTVVTTIAAEGMSLTDRTTAVVADEAEDFAKGIVELVRDDDLWTRISAAGLAHVDETFGRQALRSALDRMLRRAAEDYGPTGAE